MLIQAQHKPPAVTAYVSKGEPEPAPFSTFSTHQSRKLLHHLPLLVELLHHAVYVCNINACTFRNTVLSGGI